MLDFGQNIAGYAEFTVTAHAGETIKLRVGELPNPEQPIAGDVNGDKSVTVDDAILVLRHIASLETLSGDALTAADMNGDGGVDVNDAIAILSKIAGAN